MGDGRRAEVARRRGDLLSAPVAVRKATVCGAAVCVMAVGACVGHRTRLDPAVAGCYAVEVSLTEAHRNLLVADPPSLVRLDTAHAGLLFVPVRWMEAAGPGVRGAGLSVFRPGLAIRDGGLVETRQRPQRPLPADSLTVTFASAGAVLVGHLARTSSGAWAGLAHAGPGPGLGDAPLVPMRLVPTDCGSERLAIGRYPWSNNRAP